MKTMKFDKELIFPVMYKEGLLFESIAGLGRYLYYKDNVIQVITSDKLKNVDVFYPENLEEIFQFKNALEFLYNRLLTSQETDDAREVFQILKKIINKIEVSNEQLLYEKLKVKFEDQE